jgi:prepilin-type N-terminal cleavage/methylation domain-containing protein
VSHAKAVIEKYRRSGFTLLEIVVAAAILGILATMVVIGVEGSSRVGGEAKRIDEAAANLAALRDAAVRYNLGDRADTSFTWAISGLGAPAKGFNPGRLSQLTTKITGSDANSCGGFFGVAQTTGWVRNFYSSPISSTTPLRIADGFYADDKLQRFDVNGNAQANPGTTNDVITPATLAIVMQNVALADAQALELRMEGDHTRLSSSVLRFTPNGNSPITVFYHMGVHGC